MIELKPHALYSRQELIELLRPIGIDADGWLGKVRPARRFRKAYWGGDLIRAIETTTTLGQAEGHGAGPENAGKRSRGAEEGPSDRRSGPRRYAYA